MERTNYWVLELLTFLLVDAEEAKDVSQEFWIKVWKKLKQHQYREEGKPEQWLRQVLYNTLYNEIRKKRKHVHAELTPEIEEEYGNPDKMIRQYEGFQFIGVAEQYMNRLVMRIVNMHVLEDMSKKEIAAKLHKPYSKVKKLYEQGIAELQHRLQPQNRRWAH